MFIATLQCRQDFYVQMYVKLPYIICQACINVLPAA